MPKTIAINLYNGVCGTLHAIGGTHCPSNILPPPHRLRFAQTAFIVVRDEKQILMNAIDNGRAYPAFVAHFANLGPRNIFNKWYRAPGIIVIEYEKD